MTGDESGNETEQSLGFVDAHVGLGIGMVWGAALSWVAPDLTFEIGAMGVAIIVVALLSEQYLKRRTPNAQ